MSEMPERRSKAAVRTGRQELPPCCIAVMPSEARDMGNPLLSISLCPSSLNGKGNVSVSVSVSGCSTKNSGGS